MGLLGTIILVIGALLVGAIGPTIDRDDGGLAYLVAAIGAVAGGYVASEWLGVLSTWGLQVGGLFVFPALIGAVLVAAVVALVVRGTSGAQGSASSR